ncbi:hypothetical protein D3C73_1467670 [compost metagenome]
MLPQQHPIQRFAGGNLFVAGLGREQLVEQVIDHGVGDACIVFAALDPDLAGMEVLPLLKAWA